MSAGSPSWDAIIVAGGRASRLGGIDKPALLYEGRSLLKRSLDAVRKAERVSVVGYGGPVEQSDRVLRTEESPRWGGPAAAIVAGLNNLRHSDAEFTAVVAGDMPHVAQAVGLLLTQLGAGDLVDGLIALDTDHPQPLLAIYRTASLRAAADAVPSATDLSVRALVGSLALRGVALPPGLCADVDTPADAAALGIALPSSLAAG